MMVGKNVGLLLDSLSSNTGDKAILKVMKDFLEARNVSCGVVNPLSFQPAEYETLIIGGGDLIQPPGNPFYDVFRQRGRHILNAVGVNSNRELEYLADYRYLSVRSEGDAEIARKFGLQPYVVPCVSMVLEKKPVAINISPNTIGIHLHSISYAHVPDLHRVFERFSGFTPAFLPFTHYNEDNKTMEYVASKIGDARFFGLYSPEELYWIISKFRAFVCSSLHAAIFAYANNIPFVVFPYSAKVTRFLKDRGLEKWVFRDSSELSARLSEILDNPPDYRNLLATDIARIRTHLDTIAELITRGESEQATASATTASVVTPGYQEHVVSQRLADIHYLEKRLGEIVEENWRMKQTIGHKTRELLRSNFTKGTRRGEFRNIISASVAVAREQGALTLAKKTIEKVRKRQFRILAAPIYSIPDSDYAEWIRANEASEEQLAEQRANSKNLQYRPLVTIVTPVWNPPPEVLADTLRSVLSQTYDNWEMCIADGGSNEVVRDLLREFASRDDRIKVVYLDRNFGISGNSNRAIAIGRGEFVALLDHDDLLASNALFEVVRVLGKEPDLDFIYSDKDCITMSGKRFAPLFKPDWSPDIMLSANYVTHLCVVRTELLKDVQGFQPETDGAQDWDLFLKVAEKTSKICHIPKILYHWRLAPSSVASGGLDAKPYASRAQRLALNHHLVRAQMQAEMRFNDLGHLRIDWRLSEKPLASIVTYCKGSVNEVERCVGSISQMTRYSHFEVVVVGRKDDLSKILSEAFPITLVEGEPASCAAAYNLGAKAAKGRVLVFLSPAGEIMESDWLDEVTGWAVRPEIGIVGVKLLSRTGEILHGGVVMGLDGFLFQGALENSWSAFGDTEWYRDFLAVSDRCLTIRKDVFEEVGGFDERADRTDIDFCRRVRETNYRIVYTPHVRLLLHDSAKSSRHLTKNERSTVENDPYYSPNLSLEHTIPALKLP